MNAAFAVGRVLLVILSLAAWTVRVHAMSAEDKLSVLIHARRVVAQEDNRHPIPTPQNPVYYYPVAGGYMQWGPAAAGEKQLGVRAVWPYLRKALAAQGYRVAGKDGPIPTLLLRFYWGCMNPDRLEVSTSTDSDDNSTAESILNLREMLALTGGYRLGGPDSLEHDTALNRAGDDRYFVLVTAWDFAGMTAKPQRKQLVWQCILSVPSAGTTFEASLVPMIAAGASAFGKDQREPQEVDISYQAGKVILGPIEVIDQGRTVIPREK